MLGWFAAIGGDAIRVQGSARATPRQKLFIAPIH